MVEILHWEPNPDEFALVRTELFSVVEARPMDLRHIANFKVSCKALLLACQDLIALCFFE